MRHYCDEQNKSGLIYVAISHAHWNRRLIIEWSKQKQHIFPGGYYFMHAMNRNTFQFGFIGKCYYAVRDG